MHNMTGYVLCAEHEYDLNDEMVDQLIQRIRGCQLLYSLERTPVDDIVISGPQGDLIVFPASRHWSFLCDLAEEKASLANDLYGQRCDRCKARFSWDGSCACV